MLIKPIIIVFGISKLDHLLKFGEEVVRNRCFSARVRSMWSTLILKLNVINWLLVVLILSPICRNAQDGRIVILLYFIC